MFSLKQKIPVCVVLLIIALIASSTVSFAHSVSHPSSVHTTSHLTSQVHPNYRGGGCSGTVNNGPASSYARYNSCLGGTYGIFTLYLYPDTYMTFGSQYPNLWSYCYVYIDLVDGNGNLITNAYSTDCLGSARASAVGVHFGGCNGSTCSDPISVGTGTYYARVGWEGVYNGKVILGYYVFSPALFV